MELKEMLLIAKTMKQNNSFLLDLSELELGEINCIAVLCKNHKLYNFFDRIKEIPMEKLLIGLEVLDLCNKQKELMKKYKGCR